LPLDANRQDVSEHPPDGRGADEATRTQPRRVLMLAHAFPPGSDSGVPRTVKFIKYLDRLGWRSTVIAPMPAVNDPSSDDAGFGDSIPATTEVVRAGVSGDHDSQFWNALHRLPMYWRVADAVRAALEFPDAFATWARQALPIARAELARRRHRIIYSTSPPVTSHYIALQLKREFGLPWVADFRDPWTDDALLYGNPPRWRRSLDRKFERRIYKTADRIVVNTPTNRTTLIERHGVPPEKVIAITNGYDEEDFQGIKGSPPTDRFRIAYCGTFHSTYNPTTFLRALKALLVREPGAPVVFTLAGRACDWIRNNVHDPELLVHCELLGQISHHDVYALLAASHLLLHTYPQGIPYSVPGKLYEYLRSGRPVVAICDRPSEVASMLESTGRGRAFRPDEAEELAAFLRAEYARWRVDGTASSIRVDDRIRIYERAALTARLAEVFEKIAK